MVQRLAALVGFTLKTLVKTTFALRTSAFSGRRRCFEVAKLSQQLLSDFDFSSLNSGMILSPELLRSH